MIKIVRINAKKIPPSVENLITQDDRPWSENFKQSKKK